ncbi:uncharacterized protein LOC141643998 [Silene latifolia]|uniref:uncharacterized protein LOC141643998 n=1 Tax=Silene latifolia TaxID=37657 RepID=UPI003D78623C
MAPEADSISSIAHSNPYDDPTFLPNSDHLGMMLTSAFDGKSFFTWSRGIVMALATKNKCGFIDGSTPTPAQNDPSFSKWLRTDYMVRCWILNSMTPNIKDGFMTCKSAKRLWTDLNDIFLKKILEIITHEKVMTFLMGLDDTYDTLKTNILSMDPLPNLTKAYSLVQQIESQKRLSKMMSSQSDSSATAANRRFNSGNCSKSGESKDARSITPWNVWTKDAPSAKKQKKEKRWCDHSSNAHNAELLNKEDNPLVTDSFAHHAADTNGSGDGDVDVDPKIIAAIYKQMMEMKRKGSFNSHGGIDYSAVNFAGTILVPNATSCSCSMQTSVWIIDSGATVHMSSLIDQFLNLRKLDKPVKVGLLDGTSMLVTRVGTMHIRLGIVLHNVLYIPDFKHNLLFVGKLLCDNELLISFDVDKCLIQDPMHNQIVGIGKRTDGLYKLKSDLLDLSQSAQNKSSNNISLQGHNIYTCKANSSSKVELFHARLGHTSLSKMKHIEGINCNGINNIQFETCVLAKMHQLPFNRSNSRALHAFDLIHIDLWRHYRHATFTGASYFLTIVDDHTRVTWTFILKDRLQVYDTIKSFITQVNTQYNGVKSALGVPQQNSRFERKHRHLVETVRALLLFGHLRKKFWGECLLAATHIINKLPTPILDWKTPSEVLFKKKCSYDELRLIGCLCFALIPSHFRGKFSSKARKCIFLGYPFAQKAYKLYDLTTHKIDISRDFVFHENILPYKSDPTIPAATTQSAPLGQMPAMFNPYHPLGSDDEDVFLTHSPVCGDTSNKSESGPDSTPFDSVHTSTDINNEISPNSDTTLNTSSGTPVDTFLPRISSREVHMPARFQEFVCPIVPHRRTSVTANTH